MAKKSRKKPYVERFCPACNSRIDESLDSKTVYCNSKCKQIINGSKYRSKHKWNQNLYISEHLEQKIVYSSRSRAKKKGLDHDLSYIDIVIPDHCPICSIKLERGTVKDKKCSPTLDRIDNDKGYVKENIWIICHRCNSIKRDASLKELKRLVEVLEEKSCE